MVAVRVGDAGHGGGRVRMLGVIICRHIVWSVGEVEGEAGGAVRLLFSRAVVLAGVVPSYVRGGSGTLQFETQTEAQGSGDLG